MIQVSSGREKLLNRVGSANTSLSSTYTPVSDTVLGSAGSTVNKTFRVTVLMELSASQEDMPWLDNKQQCTACTERRFQVICMGRVGS